MPFWCIFAQSAVIRNNIYTETYDGLLFFRKREVREEKKNVDKVTRAVGFVGTKYVPGFCDVFWILGSVFGFWEGREVFLDSKILGRVLDSAKCFVLVSHGTFRPPCFFQIISLLNASN